MRHEQESQLAVRRRPREQRDEASHGAANRASVADPAPGFGGFDGAANLECTACRDLEEAATVAALAPLRFAEVEMHAACGPRELSGQIGIVAFDHADDWSQLANELETDVQRDELVFGSASRVDACTGP